MSKIFLTGYTPAPTDRFGRKQPEIQKTSLGASDLVPWEQTAEATELVERLRSEGVQMVAVEQTSGAIPLSDFQVPEKVAYVMGNEVEGVSKPTLEAADIIVEIPMLGSKESLNVSVAAGIILYYGIGQ